MTYIRFPRRHILRDETMGKNLREEYNIDNMDDTEGIVCVLVSNDTFMVFPEFFLGCFKESIRKLGDMGFRNKYKFYGEYEFHKDYVDKGISYCEDVIKKEKES